MGARSVLDWGYSCNTFIYYSYNYKSYLLWCRQENKEKEMSENMLYLMLDKRENHYYAKVGLAKKPRERRRAYATHNPCAIMRSTCAGMGNEEVICQNKLSQMSICRIKSTEWYEIDKQTFEYLYTYGMGALRPKQQPIHFIEE